MTPEEMYSDPIRWMSAKLGNGELRALRSEDRRRKRFEAAKEAMSALMALPAIAPSTALAHRAVEYADALLLALDE